MPAPAVARRKARERALQILYGLDFTKYDWRDVLDPYWASHASRPAVKEYAEKLVAGVWERREALDAELQQALEHWRTDRIGAVERNVLRVALYEMRYCDDVPPPVAINEAIEVAKLYGSEDAPRFVNGVLDRLRKRQAESAEGEAV